MADNEVDPKDLRAQLEAANARAKAAEDSANAMKLDIQLRDEAGLGHLNPRQRRTVLREVAEEGEFSPDLAKKVAGELGYNLAPAPASPPTSEGVATSPAPVNGTEQPPSEPVRTPATDALDAFSAMDQANLAAIRGQVDPTFQEKMKNVKSKEELTHLIRTEGAASGIVHAWDRS